MKEDKPKVPNINKVIILIKWSKAFLYFLSRYVGCRAIPLSYIAMLTVPLPATPPPLLANLPYSDDHGSVEGKLLTRAYHTHTNYRDDNQAVCFLLEEATRSTFMPLLSAPSSAPKMEELLSLSL